MKYIVNVFNDSYDTIIETLSFNNSNELFDKIKAHAINVNLPWYNGVKFNNIINKINNKLNTIRTCKVKIPNSNIFVIVYVC